MTTSSTPANERIKAMMTRHGLNQPEMARLMGVPVGTLRNWIQGIRTPPASATRLVQVLETAEVLSPILFNALQGKKQ